MIQCHNESSMNKLRNMHSNLKIPNIIFYGPCGSGKKTLVTSFIQLIYNNSPKDISQYTLQLNCVHSKGIKFIRDDLKFFAKTTTPNTFKTVILLNADKLTMDAQSVLRRCIEIFSHTTRFFIVVENTHSLLHPILSRFCKIFIPQLNIKHDSIIYTNLYEYNIALAFKLTKYKASRQKQLKTILKNNNVLTFGDTISLSTKIYAQGFCGLDIIQCINNTNDFKHNELMFYIMNIKKDIKYEPMFMCILLHHFSKINTNTSVI